jgi:hypothetical protein
MPSVDAIDVHALRAAFLVLCVLATMGWAAVIVGAWRERRTRAAHTATR